MEMEKYLVVATLICYDMGEEELHSSQWLVGTFNTIEECMVASRKDLIDIASEHYECVIPEEDFYNEDGELYEEEYNKAIEDSTFNYIEGRWEALISDIEIGLASSNSVEIMSNDFIDNEFTDQRHVVKYYLYKS